MQITFDKPQCIVNFNNHRVRLTRVDYKMVEKQIREGYTFKALSFILAKHREQEVPKCQL